MTRIFFLGAALLAAALAFLSCDLLRDGPFEVSGWSPGEGSHAAPEEITLSLLFSRNPDRISVERSFSLTGEGVERNGSFSWEGRRLSFFPAYPLEPNQDYLISLSTNAQDERGLSLEKKFEAPFSTRTGKDRPRVVSVDPPYDGLLESLGEVRLVFSGAVTVNSCVNHASWSPSAGGAWRLENEGLAAVFSPAEPWKPGTRYRLNVSTAFTGENGLPLEREYSTRFKGRLDTEAPVLTGLWALEGGGEEVLLIAEDLEGPVRENPIRGKDTRFRLDFSEPVDVAGLKNRLSLEPSPQLILETAPGFASSVTFRLSESPAWQSRFLIRLAPGVEDAAGNGSLRGAVFQVYAGEPPSKPPSLAGIRLALDLDREEGRQAFSPETVFGDLPLDSGRFPFDRGVPFQIELYFDTAPGAAVDPFSLMDLFRVESTNNALSFSPKSIRDSDFTRQEPHPRWAACSRLEIQGILTNSTRSGVVSFRIGPGLLDSFGNRSGETFRVSLLK